MSSINCSGFVPVDRPQINDNLTIARHFNLKKKPSDVLVQLSHQPEAPLGDVQLMHAILAMDKKENDKYSSVNADLILL
jgi:hypothetical protein